jgi:hypothetical protein
MASMAFAAAPALASKTHPYTGLSFGPDGTAGTSFGKVQGVAVDQAGGNVYVYDAGSGGKVYKFDSVGNPVSFSALGGNAIEGVGSAGGAENEIAVAPAGAPAGTAGDIYVANNQVVKIYGPTGASLGELTGGETCGVAVNPAGHVFVGVYPNEVREYTPSANPAVNADQTGVSAGVVESVCNVAADGLGNVYAAKFSGGVQKLEGLGDASASLLDPSGTTLGVDPASGDLYANRESAIAQYSSGGALLGIFGSGQLSASRGVAVHAATDEIYAGNGDSGKVDVFGPAIVLPGIDIGSVSGITGTKATLNASVNPDGLAVSECKFEYGTTTAYGSSKPCEGAIPTDSSDHPVAAALTGLTSNTTYHFRTVATNANGTNQSGDQSFTTNQPAITGEANSVTGSKATLNGVVSPEGEAISECFFEYGIQSSFDKTAPCEGAIPVDEGEHSVTAQLTHLVPNGTVYEFRLVINRPSGINQGNDRSFATADTIVTGASSAVTATSATVEGTLNPEGTLYTECLFEYGPTVAYGSTALCTESPASIGEGSVPITVHADLSGLTLGTSYHYRLVGVNPDGSAPGADKNFKTSGPPAIEAAWAESAVLSEATLKAKLNPEGSPSTYHIEYGTDSSYGQSTPEANVGADKTSHTVTSLLEGLTPGTVYHWRVVATNSVGVSEGSDHTFTTYKPAVQNASCLNQRFRTGASAHLPDCRAYEMVSPVDKNGTDIAPLININGILSSLNQSAVSGEKLTYSTSQGFGDAQGVPYSSQYLASRESGGWSTHGITPSQGLSSGGLTNSRIDVEFRVFTPELCEAALVHPTDPPLAPGAVTGFLNVYLRHQCGEESYEALTTTKPPTLPATSFEPEVAGLSTGGRCTVFYASDQLTPDANPGTDPLGSNQQIYESCGGSLHLVSVLPSGGAAEASSTVGTGNLVFGFRSQSRLGAVSSDGSRIYWTQSTGAAPLLLRLNAEEPQSAISGGECTEAEKACTIRVSETATNGAAHFWSASSDGSKALFTVENVGLYEFDLATRSSTLIAPEVPSVIGASKDATRISFVSRETLTGTNAQGKSPTSGKPNLYFFDSGKSGVDRFRFIGTLSSEDAQAITSLNPGISPVNFELYKKTSRVSPDGRQVVFMSSASLTGFDNTDANNGKEDAEIFAFDATADAGEGELRCISCNPSEQRPTGRNIIIETFPSGVWGAAQLPPYETDLYGSRVVSDDGSRIFFNSYEALVPNDTNGKADVYEWEKPGAGDCVEGGATYSSLNDGCLNLISSGESPTDSTFVDASADGRDVFFTTASSLLPQDPGLIDIYDARAGGGYPPPANPPGPCEGEACQAPPTPPNDPTPASAAFEGPGNVREGSKPRCAKGKARRKGRCAAKKRRHPAKHKSQRANDNRRNAR